MNEVDAFLRKGGSVCPFAAGSSRTFVRAGKAPPFNHKALLYAALKFSMTCGKTPNGSLIVLGLVEGYEETKTWAREIFLELMVCFGAIGDADESAVARYIAEQARPILCDDSNKHRVSMACNGQPIFAICMAPVYPKTHPRYAPQAAVVVTWQADVGAAAREPARSRIRAVMAREHGSLYDADELMLPLPAVTDG